MMILTGLQIKEEIKNGGIKINPFKEGAIQPNSYDFHLGRELIIYDCEELNSKGIDNFVIRKERISDEGYLLKGGELYLGITEESTETIKYSQLLFGDKSLGSLGIWTQITAPLAHVGSKIRWTLEIRCIKDVWVYPGMKFGKICFLENYGKIRGYCGRYRKNEITHSLICDDKNILNKEWRKA